MLRYATLRPQDVTTQIKTANASTYHTCTLVNILSACLFEKVHSDYFTGDCKKGNKKHTKKERHNIIASLHTNEALNQPKTKLIGRRSNTNTMYMYVKSVINRFKTIDTIYIFRLRQCWLV